MKNKNGLRRFQFYLDKLEDQLEAAGREKNPALWLYTHDGRTTFFMLEGLAKLYAGIHNKKKFEKIKEHFKLVEDAIGAVDYYDSYAKEFMTDPGIPANVVNYMQAQAREKIQSLNEILNEEKWLSGQRIAKISGKLEDADWLDAKDELKGIFGFYKSSIEEIKTFFTEAGGEFKEIEAQVHDVRRKLRWLSIYPQALQGVVQLNESDNTAASVQKYLVPEIVNSPFNKMPPTGSNTHFLLLEKNYFLALSWMIAELGKLKDVGLKVLAVAEALQQTEGADHDMAVQRAAEILGLHAAVLDNVLTDASTIFRRFMEEKNLDNLIFGITSVK